MKVALITGASRGIGFEIATQMAQAGYQVVGTATSEKGLEAIQTIPGEVSAFILNQQDKQSIETLVTTLKEKSLLPDVLVNNAGITADNLMLRMKDDEWQRVIDTNLSGVFYLTQRLLKPMIKKRAGSIVNISSVVGYMGNPGQANYCAAKAGLVGFTKSLALEIASRHINVNLVAPGFIETDMTQALADEQKESLLKNIPMQRMGSATDIAQAVLFLCSDAASYMTGQTLHVNGGMFLG